nr:hypothetical protein [Tanacetum cinerariifolium]
MSQDVLTIGSTIRIALLYRGEYSQWVERFMNYHEEQTDGEAMINSIKNGDQPLPCVTQVSIAGTTSTEQPPLKDKSMWSDQDKRVQKIDRLARSLLIQGLPNDIYLLIDSNKTAKDLWDALARHMLGSEYSEQDRKAAVLYEYKTFKATEGELLLDTYIRYLQVINDLKKCGYSKDNCELNFKFLNNLQQEWKQYATTMRQNKNLMDINIDALYNILKQNQGDVNDAIGSKKKTVVVTFDPLALIAEKTNVSRSKEKVVVSSDSKGSEADDFKFVKTVNKRVEKKDDEKKKDMSRVKCYNYKKEGHFAKDCKKAKVKDYEYYKTKMLLAKKDKDEQFLLAEDQAWMESSSDSDQETNENMVFMAQIEKVVSDSEASSSSADEKISENRTAHIDYLKHTLEEAATLRELVESERLLSPLNTSLVYACKYTRRIQELLMILQQTCLIITDLGTTLVAVTPKNQNKQVRRVALVSSASGSQSKDNTKKNRIRRTLKKAKETELEDHPRKVKSSLNKASIVASRSSSSVLKSVSNVNANLKCASCNGCLFSDNHDKCVVEYINSVNASRKSKSAKKPVNRKVWKTTGKVFKTVGYKWTPTGRTF